MYFHLHNTSLFRVIQKLPTDLLGALDLDHLLTPTQLTQQEVTIPSFGDETKTTTQELRENVLTFQRIYTNSGVSPERIVAKALVDCVIHSAQKRVTPPIFTFGASLPSGIGYSPSIKQQTYLRVNNSGVGVDGMRMEWREIKRASSVSVRCLKESTFRSTSGVSMESEGYVSATSDCCDFPRTERRKVSFHVGEQRPFMSMDTVEEVDEEELRIVAKKLVMKILHMACKEVESLYRRSSIEYLIANTKRMKIEESPSPPPVLFNIAEEDQDGTDCSDGKRPNPFSDLRPSSSERSPTPEHLLLRRLGKKRGRSGSHEVSGLREFVETSRRSKVVRKIINFKERIMGGIQQSSGGSVKSPNDDSSSQSGDEGTSFTSLVSNLSRMTIGGPPQESDTESEPASNADESFTILNAITVSEDPLAGLRDEANTADSSKRFHFQDPTTSIHQRSNHLGAAMLFPTTNSTHNTPTTSPLAVQSLSSSSPLMNGTSSSSIESSVVPDMDIFVVIHSRPTPGECQKFLCNNTNEVNLMYHCWMYPNTPFDPSLSITGKLEMGVFEPSYVEPVHLDLQDAGVPFYYIDERYIYYYYNVHHVWQS